MKPEVNKHKNTKAIKRSIGYGDTITLWGDLAEQKHCSFGHRPYWGKDPPAKIISDIFSTASFLQNQLLVHIFGAYFIKTS